MPLIVSSASRPGVLARLIPHVLLLSSAAFATGDIDESRLTAVVRAVKRVKPAVVSVHVIHRTPVFYRHRDPFFDLFFPRQYAGEREHISGGSGLIVSEDGFILTNDHVISVDRRQRRGRPPRIEIFLPDGRTLEVESVSSDLFLDLAMLKVEAQDLPVAPLGRSSDILVGEWAIAIGNPFDLGPTVTAGVVSAVDRDFEETKGNYYYRNMIQTDAAINPGNSGGPLVNALGEVIGINSFIYTGSEYSTGSIGIGFAIPVDAARRFLEEVRTHGEVRRPWSGILGVRDLTPRWGQYLDLPVEEGALVRLPDHTPRLSDAQAKEAESYLQLLESQPYSPPTDAPIDPEVLTLMADEGTVVKVSETVVFSASAYKKLVDRISEYINERGEITVADVRDLFGTSRKYALALMDHLDHERITRRVGDVRVLR